MKKQTSLFIIVLLVGGVIGFFLGNVQEAKAPSNGGVAANDTPLTVPEGAQQMGECVPNMGFHHARPEDMPRGPVYVTDADENVIGVEYIVDESELEENTMETHHGPAGVPVTVDPFDRSWEAVDLAYMPQGIENYQVPHYQLHFYASSTADRADICEGADEHTDEEDTTEQENTEGGK